MNLLLRPRTHRPVSMLVLTPTSPPTRWWLPGLLMILLTSAAWAQCFQTATSFGAGSLPGSVAVGDFNGDGKPDLAVANVNSNNVSVLLGNGSGGFGAATNFAVGDGPTSVAVGDFNGDNNADLAVPNSNSSNVSVLLGNGSGGFGAPTNFGVGGNPRSVAVGDFNGDTNADLAVPNSNSSNVSVLLGNGSGGFGAPTNFGVGGNPRSVAVGDFNGDTNADLVVANSNSSNVSVLLGNGSGGFGAPTNFGVGSNPRSVVVGDFNGDNKPDLATTNAFGNSGNSVSVLLGNGSGGFGAATNFAVGAGPTSMAVGDFNGDNKPDLAAANVNSGRVSVLLGNGSGGFGAATNFEVGLSPNSVAVGDFNGDSKPDLTTANGLGSVNGSGSVSVLLNGIPVLITTQPSAGSVICAGSTVTAQASATAALSYQWYRGSTLLNEQTSATLSLTNVSPTDQGSYSVVVTGNCNSATSTAFNLTVNTPVSLSNDGPLTCFKSTALLTATPDALGTYAFGGPGPGQSGTSSTITVSQTGVYSVTLTSATGCTSTAQTTVTAIGPTPFVATQSTPDGLVVQVSGGVQYERIKAIDRINGYEIRQTEQNTTGYFLITQPGTYAITVIGANGCRATVTGAR